MKAPEGGQLVELSATQSHNSDIHQLNFRSGDLSKLLCRVISNRATKNTPVESIIYSWQIRSDSIKKITIYSLLEFGCFKLCDLDQPIRKLELQLRINYPQNI